MSSDCYCAACRGSRFIICFLKIKISHGGNPLKLYSFRHLRSTEVAINSARRSNISALRLYGGFKSNFASVPSDDTAVPVIFSYRRMCIWDAKLSLGDVSQSAKREIRAESDAASAGETARVDCSARSARGRGEERRGRERCFVITVADKWSRDSLIPSNYIWWGPFTPNLSLHRFWNFSISLQSIILSSVWFSIYFYHKF